MTLTAKIDTALDLIASEVMHAKDPVVLCSFGKDSIVMLDLCLSIRTMPVLFFANEPQKFPDKYAHAYGVIEHFKLKAFTLPPRAATYIQDGEYFEIFQTYGGDTTGPLTMALGSRPWQGDDKDYVCTVDLLMRPMATKVNYPWDLTFHGHKECDDIKLAKRVTIVQPVIDSGSTRLVLPIWDWTDEDIWAYIKQRELPYDKARYEEDFESVNPDVFPVCRNCLDTRHRGEKVYCPVLEQFIQNKADSDAIHAERKRAILGTVTYAQFTLTDPPPAQPAGKFMEARETWPLFSVSKKIFDERVYLIIDDLVDISKKPDGLKRLREEWIRLELRCAEAGITGWLCHTDRTNARMQRCLKATGATPYAEDATGFWLKKLVDPQCRVFPSLRDMAVAAMGEAHA